MELTLNTRNAGPEELTSILRDQRARRLDVVATATAIKAENGWLRVEGTEQIITDEGVTTAAGLYQPTGTCESGLAERLDIDLRYLRKLREERPDMWDANVNGRLLGGVSASGEVYPPNRAKHLLRLLRGDTATTGVARAFLSSKYLPIENLDIFLATLQGVRNAGVEAHVDRCDLTPSRMYVRMVAPQVKALAPALLKGYRNPFGPELERWRSIAHREGMGYGEGEEPVVYAGFVFSNSETGGGAYNLFPHIIIQICKNGLTIKTQARRAIHRGSDMDEGVLNYSADTVEKMLALISARTRDSVQAWMTEGWLEETIGELEEMAGVPVTDPVATIREVVRQTVIPQAMENELLTYFTLGGQMTAAGVAGAVSAAAQLVDDADLAAEMEALAVPAMDLAARIG